MSRMFVMSWPLSPGAAPGRLATSSYSYLIALAWLAGVQLAQAGMEPRTHAASRPRLTTLPPPPFPSDSFLAASRRHGDHGCPPLGPGNQSRDLRHLHGRHAPQREDDRRL